jgi:hypothetical protein
VTTRGQRRARRQELEQAAHQVLPPELAPVIADRVFQQEAQATALGQPFDAGAAITQAANNLRDEAEMQQKVAENEEKDVELLLFGT